MSEAAPLLLFMGGAGLMAMLGLMHVGMSLTELAGGEPRLATREILDRMNATPMPMAKGRTTVGLAWVGFNVSHGVGVAGIFGLFLYASLREPALVGALHLRPIALGMALLYAGLGLRFWFWAPVAGSLTASAAIALSLLLG